MQRHSPVEEQWIWMQPVMDACPIGHAVCLGQGAHFVSSHHCVTALPVGPVDSGQGLLLWSKMPACWLAATGMRFQPLSRVLMCV